MKFHEEFLNRWRLQDMRIEYSVKILEIIYSKIYFNQNVSKITDCFDKLRDANNYYFNGTKKYSSILNDGFNCIKALVMGIKCIRKDSQFKLTLLGLVKRFLLVFLLNLYFLSLDYKISLEQPSPEPPKEEEQQLRKAITMTGTVSGKLSKQSTANDGERRAFLRRFENFPPLINTFLEFGQKYEQFGFFFEQTFKVNRRQLALALQKDYYKAFGEQISRHFVYLFQRLYTRHIDAYFEKNRAIASLPMEIYFTRNIDSQFQLGQAFDAPFSTVVEEALLDSTLNNIFEIIAGNYGSPGEFSADKKQIAIMLAQLQGKVGGLKLSSASTKEKCEKIIMGFTKYFSSNNKPEVYIQYLSLGCQFKQNFSILPKILRLKRIRNALEVQQYHQLIQQQTACLVNVKAVNHKANLFVKCRVAKNLAKFANKLRVKYIVSFGNPTPQQEGEEDEGEGLQNGEGQGEAKEEALKKPSDPPEVMLLCRYFQYKKTEKQNYGYIKYK